MKKLMLISSRFPFPPIGGDRLKNYNLIKILSKSYDIHFVSLIDRDLNKEDIEFCKRYCKEYKIFKKSKISSIISTAKSIFNRKPLQVNYYYFSDVQKYINEKVDSCDFIINTLIRTSEYVKNINKPKYLDMVDSIALNYKRSEKNVKSKFWKIIYKYEIIKLLNYEKECLSLYDNTFFVNKEESEYWKEFGKTIWIPNGVNNMLFDYNKKNSKYINYIAFFGKMDYQPNIDAVIWFINNIFDELNKNIKFIIVGSNPTGQIKNLENDRIKITGFIEDPYEVLNSCFCCIAPMLTGGGIQNKILETMALGKITLTTTLGATPILGAKNNSELLIADNVKDMITLINDLYESRNTQKFSKIEINSKEFIKNNFTWDSYEKKLKLMLNR
ncbi:glycosyltransferase [Aliarcobacter cryaerophilus]|uniref:glycosyltransferase n=1 Tax=Aliarcobacter cryaerophilus TaxID=28198 RepID=UPI0021B6E242|nr:glycosyltransferase [Aliarcobacter cryaerophilus]MCT7520533.1 glycosyltransferase [Aliarcobacter cryaerophilus]